MIKMQNADQEKTKDSIPVYEALHVDDNASFLKLFSMKFSPDLKTTSVQDGKTALEMLKNKKFDIVLLDYEMQGMNGLELLHKIKELYPDLPVIFYTGQGNEEVAREAFLLGASDYIVKDFSGLAYEERFLNTIKNVIGRSKSEKELRTSTDNLEAVLWSISEAVIITDIQGIIEHFNPAATRITGWEQSEVKGKSIEEIFSIISDGTTKDIKELIEEPKEISENFDRLQIRLKNGSLKNVEFSASPIKNKGGTTTGIIIIFR